jgi:multidrug efflux pump subunit AcrA (membrane-fusion protein)
MMRGKWILLAGVALIAAGGVGAMVWLKRQAPAPKAVVKAEAALPKGAEVSLTGKIQAVTVAHIDVPLDGVLEELAVKAGDDVFEGQILARIANAALRENAREAQVEVERAQARISALEAELTGARLEDSRLSAELSRARTESLRTERTYQRQEMLRREGATPRLTFERAQKEVSSAREELDQVQALAGAAQDRIQRLLKEIELGKRTEAEKAEALEAAKSELAAADVVAPADGLVVAVKRGEGEEVQKAMGALIDIATDLTQLEVVVEAPGQYTRRLAAGQPALIVMAELPGNGLQAVIKAVEAERVVVEFSSPSPLVKPGMTAAVRFKLN